MLILSHHTLVLSRLDADFFTFLSERLDVDFFLTTPSFCHSVWMEPPRKLLKMTPEDLLQRRKDRLKREADRKKQEADRLEQLKAAEKLKAAEEVGTVLICLVVNLIALYNNRKRQQCTG